MKYKVRFVGRIEWIKEVDIKDDSDPYPELNEIAENLLTEDGFADQAYIEPVDVKPIMTFSRRKMRGR